MIINTDVILLKVLVIVQKFMITAAQAHAQKIVQQRSVLNNLDSRFRFR